MEIVSESLEIANWFAICLIFRKNDGKAPVILIDFQKLFISMTHSSVNSILLGGRHNIYFLNFDRFFRRLIEAGAKLVFFKRGTQKRDFTTFVEEKVKSYRECLRDLDEIEAGSTERRGVSGYRIHLGTEFKDFAQKYGEYFLTLNDHLPDIAAYAIRHENVLAFLSRDSNFLFFHGMSPVQYWSCAYGHLSFHDFTTKRFNIDVVHQALLLTGQQVALLGTILHFFKNYEYYAEVYGLTGIAYSMRVFFREIKNQISDYKWKASCDANESVSIERFHTAASIIWKHFEADKPVSDDVLRELIQLVMGHQIDEKTITAFKDEFIQFDIANFPPPPEPLIPEVHNCNFINKILSDLRFIAFPVEFTDFRPSTRIPYVDLTVPIYRKLAGILLQHKQAESPICRLAIQLGHFTPFEKVDEDPIYPEGTMSRKSIARRD